MQTSLQNVRDRLMATNEEFSRLAKEHTYYEQQLQQLADRSYLTDAEKLDEVNMKKRKLSLKDQMERMIQQYRTEGSPVA